ncbi:MAG: SMP-30/gluconolactonase/LRE family protein [Acholeplasmatales bacterium]|nr:SMP-30/gluconolactonase/LRE family protein [Acholeplasmatales bacterium]
MDNLELLCNIKNKLGEGPIYDYKNKSISFVDIVGKKLCILYENNNLKEVEFNEKIGAAIPNGNGGFLVCCENKIFLYDNNEIKEYKSLDSIITPGMRCNDAKADMDGRLYFSTMVDDGINKPHGGLYCLNNNEIICLDNNVKLGNGLAWNKANNKFYYSDSVEHKIFVFDYDEITGMVSNKKVLFEITDGAPDGMTIDSDGNLFVAVWGGSRIEVRSGVTGDLIDVIKMPTRLVTSCCFVGDALDRLVITTAKLDETDDHAGNIFITKTKYKGLKENYVK